MKVFRTKIKNCSDDCRLVGFTNRYFCRLIRMDGSQIKLLLRNTQSKIIYIHHARR